MVRRGGLIAGGLVGALLAVAAVAAASLAVTHAPEAASVPRAEGWIATFILAFLLVLGARHLLLLALAMIDHLAQLRRRPGQADDTKLPLVSIIVPAFNEAPMIAQVLESLLEIDYPRFEVVVVDDGSSDQTFLRALPFRHRRPAFQYRVLTKANGGKFDALNHGIAKARGEIVVCIDGDSVLQRDALRHLVARFDDPAVGAVAGCVRVVNRGTLWSAMQAVEYVAGLGLVKRAQSAAGLVAVVPGPLGAFRKSALAQVNGYDGDTFAEDFDLTLKLLSAGWQVEYEPAAVVFTEAPERTLELMRQRYRWSRGSLQALRKRSAGLRRPLAAPLRCLGLWYLVIEYLGWPALHVGVQLSFVAAGLLGEVHHSLFFWWLQLALLETALIAFCVALEREALWLVALGPLFRVFYLVVLDTTRLLAAADEFRRAGMSWDKVARLGTLTRVAG